MNTGVIKYDEMIRAVAECHAIDEVKDWRDKARALEAYAAQANNIEAERKAIEIRLRAERRCGELIRIQQENGELATVADGANLSRGTTSKKTLADVGISRDQSSKFQKLADIPEEDFEQALAEQATEKPSTAAIINKFAEKPNGQVPPLSLELWGWANNADRAKIFDHDPNALLADMTDAMRARFFECLPIIIDYINQIEASQWDEKSTA